MVFALTGVMTGKEFLQADHVGPGRRRFANPPHRLVDVRLLGLGAGHLHERDGHFGRRVSWDVVHIMLMVIYLRGRDQSPGEQPIR
jgi:hypothetical protein